ncbi:MAG: transcription termination/antitermination protein NusA, partial [Candidatus Obscuribacterales bacterium]|nr:transcription termination/antitermination protein NusA [Steroidobacteraceae bacterium]
LNVMTEQAAEKKSEGESAQLVQVFKEQLDVDEEVAAILVQAGFSTIEEVAYVPAAELASIEEFDEDIVKELRNRARDVLLTQAIATEEQSSDAEPAEDLLQVEGMDDELAATLASRGIVTREDLAEQAIDDLTEIEGIDAGRAGELIMAARKHWFEASGAAK